MKKLLLMKTVLLLFALVVGSGSVWATEYSMTIDSSNNGSNNVHWTSTSTTSLTYNNVTWSTSVTGTTSVTASTTYAQIGSKNNPATQVTISTTAFAGKKITAASLTGYCMSNTGPALTITAGSTTILSSESLVKTTPTTYNATTNLPVTLGNNEALTFTINSSAKAAICISEITVTYEDVTPTGPSISADPTSLSGFTYAEGHGPSDSQTISVSGSNLTANIGLALGDNSNYEMSLEENDNYSNSLTLAQSNGTVSATDVYVRLKSGLKKAANYAGTITLTSSNATNVEVTLSGSVTGQLYEVLVNDPNTGGTIEADPMSAVEEGTTVSLTAHPDDAYTFGSWIVYKDEDPSTTVTVVNNQFTMPGYDVYVTATFNAKPTHTATFSVNGATTSNTFYEGQDIEFPADPAAMYGKTFIGWATATIDGTTNDAPEFVTSAKMGNSNVTYYAVFAKVTAGSPVTDELTTNTFGKPSSYTSWSGKTATSSAVYAGETAGGSSYIQMRATSPSGIVTTTSGGFVTKVTVSWNSGTAADRTLDIYCNPSAYTDASDLYDKNTQGIYLGSLYYKKEINDVETTTTELTFDIDEEIEYIGLRSKSNAMYLDEIDIQWTPITLSGYCTTVPSTATVTLNAACNDGEGMYYGTYSNSSAFVVPSDLIVSTVGVSAGKLTLTNYSTGDVVKANTGVLISSDESGNHTITLSNETGTENDGNMLKPSGDAGITADGMSAAASGCIYYRLTMHNGTQLGFWWGAENGASFALAANKAYLAVPNTTTAREGLWFGDDATAIETVKTQKADGQYFNLAGQRVAQPTKGLYIVNGKKVVIK